MKSFIAAILLSIAAVVGAGAHDLRAILEGSGLPGTGLAVVTDPAAISDPTLRAIHLRQTFPDQLYVRGAQAPRLRTLNELLAEASSGVRATAETVPDTLRVALLRVDFETDSAGDASTGNGRFDLSDGAGVLVDPPPHNKTYFEAHARAAARFFLAQSYGTLVIETTVFPPEPDGAFRLGDQGSYGPWRVEQSDEILLKAERFVTDAVTAADASGRVTLGEFDAVIVVHAGADFQGDVNGDTPFDIPSFVITLGEPLVLNTGSVGRVMVMPETANQDGLLGALNGVWAHELGHVLGLPDLYNIFNGVPQVGFWSVMDSGENIVAIVEDPQAGELFEARGIFPTSFDPWSKLQIFPKAMAPLLVEEVFEGALEATQVDAVLPLVSLDPFEYFLVENRALDLDGNDIPFVLQDSTTKVFLGPTDDPDRPGMDGGKEYDAVLPGGGVLIWHIDDRIVVPALEDRGQVNLGVFNRGVRVIEADGIWDQGRFNFGVPEDAFFEGNNTRFGPATIPSSQSNAGDHTGITIEVSGVPARVMGLQVRRELARAGWPVILSAAIQLRHPAIVDLDGMGGPEILFAFTDPRDSAANRHAVAGVDGAGAPFDFGSGEERFATVGQAVSRPLAAVSRFFLGPDDRPEPAVALTTDTGRLLVWDREGGEPRISLSGAVTAPVLLDAGLRSGGRVLLGTTSHLTLVDHGGDTAYSRDYGEASGSTVTAGPVLVDGLGALGAAAVGFGNGFVGRFVLDPAEPERTLLRLPAAVDHLLSGPVLAEGRPALVAATADSIYVIDSGGLVSARTGHAGGDTLKLAPALGDVDGDGLAEILTVTETGRVSAFNGDGSLAVGWPQVVGAGSPRDLKVLDLDGDGAFDVLVLDADGRFFGFDGRGRLLPAFPRPLGPFTITGAWIEDLDGDGRLTWIGAAGEGALVAARLPGAVDRDGDWRYPLGTPGGTGRLAGTGVPLGRPAALREEPILVYPNPSRGPNVEIRFVLEAGERARLTLLDVRGRELTDARLDDHGGSRPGENAVTWSVSDVAPGLYFCRIEREGSAGGRVDVAKIALLQ
jgi:M6 family metalloprotease-like protein